MNEARRIYVVGGSNVDIIYHVPRMPSEHEKLRTAVPAIMGGGSSGNTACWLAHLGHSVLMITGIADDMFADFLLGLFAEHRVDVAFGRRQPGARTGVAAIFSCGTDKKMVIGALTAVIPVETLEGVAFQPGSHLHFVHSSPTMADTICTIARSAAGCTVSSELNGRWHPERAEHMQPVLL